MLPQAFKVFLACAFGAGIGSLIALEISAMFCWVGFIAGGLAGYLSYEWKKVVSAIPTAWRKATHFRFPKYFFLETLFTVLLLLSLACWIVIFELVSYLNNPKQNVFVGRIVLIGITISSTLLMIYPSFKETENERFGYYQDYKKVFFYFFPPIVFFWHLPRGIWFCVKNTPRFIKWFISGCILVTKEWGIAICKFFWNLFLLIHSEIRVLCGIDALLGSAIGYFQGSVLIGALAGGICGVINYVLITELCLKRWGYIPIKN